MVGKRVTNRISNNPFFHFTFPKDIKLALCQMIGQSATGQGHEIFNLSEKELIYKQKVVIIDIIIIHIK